MALNKELGYFKVGAQSAPEMPTNEHKESRKSITSNV
jgi:hypothetical protein